MSHDRVHSGVMGKDSPGTWQTRAPAQVPHIHWRPGRGLGDTPFLRFPTRTQREKDQPRGPAWF